VVITKANAKVKKKICESERSCFFLLNWDNAPFMCCWNVGYRICESEYSLQP